MMTLYPMTGEMFVENRLIAKGKLTMQDYIEYNRLHSKYNHFLARFAINSFVFLLLFAVMTYTAWFIVIPFSLILGLLTTLISRVLKTFRMKQIFKSDKLMNREFVYEFDEEEIHVSSHTGDNRIKWSDLYKVKKNDKLYVFYVGRNRGMLVPRSFLASDNDDRKLNGLLSDKLTALQYKS